MQKSDRSQHLETFRKLFFSSRRPDKQFNEVIPDSSSSEKILLHTTPRTASSAAQQIQCGSGKEVGFAQVEESFDGGESLTSEEEALVEEGESHGPEDSSDSSSQAHLETSSKCAETSAGPPQLSSGSLSSEPEQGQTTGIQGLRSSGFEEELERAEGLTDEECETPEDTDQSNRSQVSESDGSAESLDVFRSSIEAPVDLPELQLYSDFARSCWIRTSAAFLEGSHNFPLSSVPPGVESLSLNFSHLKFAEYDEITTMKDIDGIMCLVSSLSALHMKIIFMPKQIRLSKFEDSLHAPFQTLIQNEVVEISLKTSMFLWLGNADDNTLFIGFPGGTPFVENICDRIASCVLEAIHDADPSAQTSSMLVHLPDSHRCGTHLHLQQRMASRLNTRLQSIFVGAKFFFAVRKYGQKKTEILDGSLVDYMSKIVDLNSEYHMATFPDVGMRFLPREASFIPMWDRSFFLLYVSFIRRKGYTAEEFLRYGLCPVGDIQTRLTGKDLEAHNKVVREKMYSEDTHHFRVHGRMPFHRLNPFCKLFSHCHLLAGFVASSQLQKMQSMEESVDQHETWINNSLDSIARSMCAARWETTFQIKDETDCLEVQQMLEHIEEDLETMRNHNVPLPFVLISKESIVQHFKALMTHAMKVIRQSTKDILECAFSEKEDVLKQLEVTFWTDFIWFLLSGSRKDLWNRRSFDIIKFKDLLHKGTIALPTRGTFFRMVSADENIVAPASFLFRNVLRRPTKHCSHALFRLLRISVTLKNHRINNQIPVSCVHQIVSILKDIVLYEHSNNRIHWLRTEGFMLPPSFACSWKEYLDTCLGTSSKPRMGSTPLDTFKLVPFVLSKELNMSLFEARRLVEEVILSNADYFHLDRLSVVPHPLLQTQLVLLVPNDTCSSSVGLTNVPPNNHLPSTGDAMQKLVRHLEDVRNGTSYYNSRWIHNLLANNNELSAHPALKKNMSSRFVWLGDGATAIEVEGEDEGYEDAMGVVLLGAVPASSGIFLENQQLQTMALVVAPPERAVDELVLTSEKQRVRWNDSETLFLLEQMMLFGKAWSHILKLGLESDPPMFLSRRDETSLKDRYRNLIQEVTRKPESKFRSRILEVQAKVNVLVAETGRERQLLPPQAAVPQPEQTHPSTTVVNTRRRIMKRRRARNIISDEENDDSTGTGRQRRPRVVIEDDENA